MSTLVGDLIDAAALGAEVDIVDFRPLGGAWVLDRLWERLGIGAAIRRVATSRRLDGEAVERVVFALVAQRALKPGSKLAATDWVARRVAIDGLEGFTDDQAYRAMDFLLDALGEIAGEVFGSVAHLLNLDLDIVFVDTTSTYWELDVADELVDLAQPVDDDGTTRPVESGTRAFGHSKDHRTDLPQVVIAMAVTRDGVPVRCWTFAGNTADTAMIRTVTDDLAGWNLHRTVWVADRGFASAANRAYLTRGGGHYIHAEKLRHTNAQAAAALQLCWLALLLRVVENATSDTWRNVRNELERLHLVTLATADGQVAQRSTLTSRHKRILAALELPEPPRFFDFTVTTD